MANISPLAFVDPHAVLAEDASVGPFAYIGPDVQIARGCVIDSGATVTGQTVVGENTHVFPLASIGQAAPGCDLPGACVIGPDNAIREHVVIYGGGTADNPTRLGRGNLVMVASQVGSSAQISDDCIFANCTIIESAARVDKFVRTSSFCVMKSGIHLGAYTFVGPYTVIDRNAPPFAMLQGGPYRVRGVNTNNLTRCGFQEEDIRTLKSVFRELFDAQGGSLNADSLARLAGSNQDNQHVLMLIESLQGDCEAGGDE